MLCRNERDEEVIFLTVSRSFVPFSILVRVKLSMYNYVFNLIMVFDALLEKKV